MTKSASHRIVLSGLLVCIGLLLPYFTAHAFGVPGTVLLPMHIPVFLMGLLCGPAYGAIGGLLTPFLSSFLTGMPSFFPMLPIMMGELFIYGLVSGFLYQKVRIPLYPSMLIAMFCGRLAYGLLFTFLLMLNNGVLQALSVTAAFMKGLPGIVLQLLLVPAVVKAVRSHWNHGAELKMLSLAKAIQMIKDGKVSCVIIKNDEIIRTASGQGISPLITIFEEEPELLKDSYVVDKLIGKAAAIVLVLGGAKRAYGELMSAAARDYLTGHDCGVSFGQLIDKVINRTGDGICPLEESVFDVEDPETGYHILKDTLNRLRNVG
ncbi:MAG TPA: ECF transporter S component [Peptococcaceae bacterium]|nr:ECF transporter S component [Peptococcaceae bacterium]HPZ70771.1 ECF transporter S component [Peptococcaceae bacterium]HQD54041.1 ECF transporter S component [Peptococcaceae bacterium]